MKDRRENHSHSLESVLAVLEPVPTNFAVGLGSRTGIAENKSMFFAGQIDQPYHSYSDLAMVNFPSGFRLLTKARSEIGFLPDISPLRRQASYDHISFRESSLRLLQIAQQLQSTPDQKDLQAEFIETNNNLYGEPDPDIYHNLIGKRIIKIAQRASESSLSDTLSSLYDDLITMVPSRGERYTGEGLFVPEAAVVEKLRDVGNLIVGNLVDAKFPQKGSSKEGRFTASDIASATYDALQSGFGEAGKRWSTSAEELPFNAIQPAGQTRLIFNSNRSPLPREEAVEIAHHELIHAITHMLSDQTKREFPITQLGFGNHSAAVEAIASFLSGELSQKERSELIEPGERHQYLYMAIGLLNEGYTFRQAFETLWRLRVLERYVAPNSNEDENTIITDSRSWIYDQLARVTNGTDFLWFGSNLSYYTGSVRLHDWFKKYGVNARTLASCLAAFCDPTVPMQQQSVLEASPGIVERFETLLSSKDKSRIDGPLVLLGY